DHRTAGPLAHRESRPLRGAAHAARPDPQRRGGGHHRPPVGQLAPARARVRRGALRGGGAPGAARPRHAGGGRRRAGRPLRRPLRHGLRPGGGLVARSVGRAGPGRDPLRPRRGGQQGVARRDAGGHRGPRGLRGAPEGPDLLHVGLRRRGRLPRGDPDGRPRGDRAHGDRLLGRGDEQPGHRDRLSRHLDVEAHGRGAHRASDGAREGHQRGDEDGLAGAGGRRRAARDAAGDVAVVRAPRDDPGRPHASRRWLDDSGPLRRDPLGDDAGGRDADRGPGRDRRLPADARTGGRRGPVRVQGPADGRGPPVAAAGRGGSRPSRRQGAGGGRQGRYGPPGRGPQVQRRVGRRRRAHASRRARVRHAGGHHVRPRRLRARPLGRRAHRPRRRRRRRGGVRPRHAGAAEL
ncbi:MAG: hypothetical protein AVDCRST_MAG79-2656, partial [uncultured Thermoleophilia bacterium]